ncbi:MULTISPECIES: acyl-CoA reductase [Pseudomonas aeruginosa group]|uniref:acyl-CoA reductase n=1 Tax=Pseudomonas aeruginosa group TaxID=136841 RepID=UPI0006B26612|nr:MULTISPECIES: acyl-CoA reductase [Pseudomonas aeruginosa group]KRU85369.1 long-chain-fatty-acyl-CoA reductase [Pseudomonas aeruginosa]MDK2349928.1 acyl-CoA reductase [Pseudomonas paraeruginosa]MEA8483663.1 acyl-CoA reductase [Pseudomonas aeruginosa]VTS14851.1 Acyl-CoA reductase (LuxC) [Streptococcus dysgalactiae subsp. equisimilis]
MSHPIAPMIIRGEVITDHLIEVGGRGGDLTFLTPDAHRYLDRLPLGNPAKLADLYALSFEDILDYCEALAERLDLASNRYLQEACELSYLTAPTTPTMVRGAYMNLRYLLTREAIIEMAESTVGIPYLEGWVRQRLLDGTELETRCFGSRALHIVAGNAVALSLWTIVRNMVLRSDAIIKAPSNDPFTALAIARTMIDMAPDHPLTRHLSVAYWKGGDQALEQRLYQPQNIEKIVAWGGFAALKHVTRYIQPGLELISLDPKRSASIIGSEAFASEASLREAAVRLATDIGVLNQKGCVCSRVAYVQSGTDSAGLERLNRFGQYVYEALLALPNTVSTRPKRYDPGLKAHVDALRLDDDWYRVIGGREGEGAIICSQLPEAVSFAASLDDRTANLVPVDSLEQMLDAVDAYTQTVGVYPEAIKDQLKDVLPLYGAQRIVSLGYAAAMKFAAPQDAIEPMRRMGKWISNQIASPETTPAPWLRPSL